MRRLAIGLKAVLIAPQHLFLRVDSGPTDPPHNLEVAGSNPVPATCFSSSETGRPQGYKRSSKSWCQTTPAFLRIYAEFFETDVIQRILRHCGLWQGFIRTHAAPRAPLAAKQPLPTPRSEFELVPDDEFRETQPSRKLQLVLDPEFL